MKDEFIQKPPVRGFMSQKQKQFREDFPTIIKDLPVHSFLDAETFKIDGYFAGENIGSVVLRVRDKNGVYVARSIPEVEQLEAEVTFLQQWKKVGANVVEVLQFVKPSKEFPIAVALLEYVPGGTTEDRLAELTSRETVLSVYKKLGNALAVMHRAKGHGYGEVADIKEMRGRYKTFQEESRTYLTPTRQQELVKSGNVTENDLSLVEKAIDIVEKDIKRGTQPVLIHDDPGVHNTFGISSIKFFDPNPRISHPLKDLATALIWTNFQEDPKSVSEVVLEGYRSETPYDELTLQACIFLRLLGKWEWWLHRGKTEKFALDWITKTRWLFEETKQALTSSVQD